MKQDLMKRPQVAIAVFLFLCSPAGGEESAVVGYCAGPPCCEYERSSCSQSDTQLLIARSRIVSGSMEFCSKLLNSQWKYLPLSVDHTVTKAEAGDYLSLRGASTAIAPKAGHFDIDNDGQTENLAWLSAYSGAGSGCDVEMFVELNRERSHITNSALSALLSNNSCETYHRAFRFDDRTYIENRRTVEFDGIDFMFPSVLTEIFILEGGVKHSVCTFALDLP